MRRALLWVALGLVLTSGVALAQPAQPSTQDKMHAKEAYERGLEAHKKGDMQKAAAEFAKADALAPSPVALQAALDAAVEADDPALGAELLERARRETPTGSLAQSVQTARTKLGGRAGRLRVMCPAPSKCLAKLDERFIDVDKAVWAKSGPHTVVIQLDGDAQTKLVDLKPDQMLDVVPTANASPTPSPGPTPPPAPTTTTAPSETKPPPTPPPGDKPAPRVLSHGLPRIFFFAGVGVTVLLGGATTYFAIDTKNKHKSFSNEGCGRANFAPCEDLQADGQRSQDATNIGIAATAVAGVVTAIVGIAFTDWNGPVITAAPNGTGVHGVWSRRF